MSPVSELLPDRTTPEPRHLQVTLGAQLPYCQAAALLRAFLPKASGFNHVTTRNRTLAIGRAIDEELCREIAQDVPSPTPPDRLIVGIDGAFVKAKRTTMSTRNRNVPFRTRNRRGLWKLVENRPVVFQAAVGAF